MPSPCVSGASSHAVPASITPSAKNFATPPLHSRPRSSRSASQRLELARRSCPASATAARAGASSARSVPSRSRRRSCVAGSPSITCAPVSPSAFSRRSCSTWRARSSGQRRPGAARSTSSCAPGSRSSPVGTPSTHTTSEPSANASGPVDLGELQRARRGERACAGPRAARTPPRRRPPRRSPAASAPRRSPAPRRTASRAAVRSRASAASTSSLRRAAR